MQNIKAKFHWELVKHVYWTPGYYYPTVRWVTRSFSYPTIRFRWVPGYLLWGWIPIPGHFEPYIAWQRASIRVPVIVRRYHPGRKIVYYTYRRVSDANDIPVYFSYNLDMNRAQKRIPYGGWKIAGGITAATTDPPGWILAGGSIWSGMNEYMEHQNETGRGDDYRYSDPLFYI